MRGNARLGLVVMSLLLGCDASRAARTPGVDATAPSPAPPAPAPEATLGTSTSPTASDTSAPDLEPQPVPDPEPVDPELRERAWIERLLRQLPGRFDHLLADPARYRLQIAISIVEPGTEGLPRLRHYRYRVDEELLFPASCIKTLASIGALKKLRRLRAKGHRVGLETPLAYCYEPDEPCDSDDETNRDGGTITIGHEIRKMQLVSNNLSYNRLFDFVGHREMNELALRAGLDSARLRSRMGRGRPASWTPRIEMYPTHGDPVVIPERHSTFEVGATTLARPLVGERQERRGKIIEEPEDYSTKNHIAVSDLHDLMIGVVLPEAEGAPDFGLHPEDRAFLLAAMTEDPLESTNPRYRGERRSALNYKLMMRGLLRVMPLEAIRYVNKPGKAYGFHLESAYVENRRSGRGVFVTAGLYANENGTTHDNIYEYDEVTRPFFRDLGEVVARELLLEPVSDPEAPTEATGPTHPRSRAETEPRDAAHP